MIKLASPDLQNQDIEAVLDVLKSGNLVQGENVEKLEKELANYLNVEHCIMVTNGTATLHLILHALGIGPGDEVILPAFSYIATANVIELVGATPIFVDIDINTFNINKNLIEEKISTKTKAVIVVHEFGLMADIHEIKKLCDFNNLFLIEDAACALGAKENELYAGTFGIAGSFSFHPRKAITSGEGGAISTNDSQLALKLKTLRNHGIGADTKNKIEFVLPGYNCRMTEIQAALLRSQLKRFDSILQRKIYIANKYLTGIQNPKLTLPIYNKNKVHSWQTFHLLLDKRLNQSQIINNLKEIGIGTNYGAQCIPEQVFYKKKYKHKSETEFPNSFIAYKQGLAIPLYEKLTNIQIDFIIYNLNKI